MAWFRTQTAGPKHVLATSVEPIRIILQGRIVTMDAAATVVPDGFIAIEANRIVHVGAFDQPLPAAFAQVQPIKTGGTIYPGLIELHNHPSYNAIPLWQVTTSFPDRSVWRADPQYKRRVSAPAALLTHDPASDNARAVIRFVECRALLGGVTTTQGLSITYMNDTTKEAYRGLVRNLELPDDPTWPTAQDQINDFNSVAEANQIYGPLLNDAAHPFIMHVSEGTDQKAHDVFEYLRQADGTRLIGKNFVAVHGTGLDPAQMAGLAPGAGLVWSPLSNYLLYGATTDVRTAKAAGVPIALGSDWAPSGTKNLLGELKIAKAASINLGGLFSDLELARMVTSTPAKMVGWDLNFGSVEPGKIADLLILDGAIADPYAGLVAATESDVVAVLIDGRPRAGRASIIDPQTSGVELIRVANQDIVLDIVDSPTHPLATMKLGDAIKTLAYALEHLPELAAQFATQHRLLADTPRMFVHLEMDEGFAAELVSGSATIGPGDVDPMQLDPITAVDDSTLRARLIANPNLPMWLRNAL